NGVYMKLCNFLRFDDEYGKRGLPRGNKLEETVWNEFSSDRAGLRKLAAAIYAGADQVKKDHSLTDLVDEEEEFPEGRLLTRLHTTRERNRRLVEKAKR